MSEAHSFFFCTVTAFGFSVLPQTVYYFVLKSVMNLYNCLQFEIKTYLPTSTYLAERVISTIP